MRATFPASFSAGQLETRSYGAAGGHRPDVGVPGFDGRGVTIGLLDTGVDAAHPYLHGRVLPGIDVIDRDSEASARPNPQDPSQLEAHGTELAGILVGSNGPGWPSRYRAGGECASDSRRRLASGFRRP